MVRLTDVLVDLERILMRFRGEFQGLGPIGLVFACSVGDGRAREMVVEGVGKGPTRSDCDKRGPLGGRLQCTVFEDNGRLF